MRTNFRLEIDAFVAETTVGLSLWRCLVPAEQSGQELVQRRVEIGIFPTINQERPRQTRAAARAVDLRVRIRFTAITANSVSLRRFHLVLFCHFAPRRVVIRAS